MKPAAVKKFVAENVKRLRLIRLPGYCPELNRDELLNQDVKTNALGKSRPTTKAEMIGTVRRHLHRRQKEPHVIRNLFKEKHVIYAARWTTRCLMRLSVNDKQRYGTTIDDANGRALHLGTLQ
ncbi:transposase [Caballeronia calidae]|nr:transposase [Caballeronia calidae]